MHCLGVGDQRSGPALYFFCVAWMFETGCVIFGPMDGKRIQFQILIASKRAAIRRTVSRKSILNATRIGTPEEGCAAAHSEFLRDHSQTIIATNDAAQTLVLRQACNPLRGCEHGCIYCYARPTHEYLGFSSGLDFETRIMVKERAPELLREALSSPKWQPKVIAMSGVTDCYQPVERKLKLTRGCLEVLAEFRNPVALVSEKRHLITRDIDVAQGHLQSTQCGRRVHFCDDAGHGIAQGDGAAYLKPPWRAGLAGD